MPKTTKNIINIHFSFWLFCSHKKKHQLKLKTFFFYLRQALFYFDLKTTAAERKKLSRDCVPAMAYLLRLEIPFIILLATVWRNFLSMLALLFSSYKEKKIFVSTHSSWTKTENYNFFWRYFKTLWRQKCQTSVTSSSSVACFFLSHVHEESTKLMANLIINFVTFRGTAWIEKHFVIFFMNLHD